MSNEEDIRAGRTEEHLVVGPAARKTCEPVRYGGGKSNMTSTGAPLEADVSSD